MNFDDNLTRFVVSIDKIKLSNIFVVTTALVFAVYAFKSVKLRVDSGPVIETVILLT